MSEMILKESDLPEKLTEVLKDIISPIQVAYFTAADENLNFKCIFSTTSRYKNSEKYSIYNLTPVFRLVLSKANIIPEKSLKEIFEKHNDQICYILDWEEIKKVLIFDLNDLDYFEDQSMVKDLVKFREEILEALDKVVYE